MDDLGHSESGSLSVTVKPKHEWALKVSEVKKDGARKAKQLREQGHRFVVEVLAPREVEGGDTIQLSGVVIKPDWRVATRLEMVESARDIITNAYVLGLLDPGLPTVLRSIIEGKGLYEHSIGEFFQLYGQFEGTHQLTKNKDTRAKMKALVGGDSRYLKTYHERGKSSLVPLPYAVRNILAHPAQKSNTLDGEGKELRTSIELLRSWMDSEK